MDIPPRGARTAILLIWAAVLAGCGVSSWSPPVTDVDAPAPFQRLGADMSGRDDERATVGIESRSVLRAGRVGPVVCRSVTEAGALTVRDLMPGFKYSPDTAGVVVYARSTLPGGYWQDGGEVASLYLPAVRSHEGAMLSEAAVSLPESVTSGSAFLAYAAEVPTVSTVHETAPLVIPGDSILEFGIAVLPMLPGVPSGAVEFRVEFIGEDRSSCVYSRRITAPPREGENAWTDAVIDLTAFAGQEVRIRFITESVEPWPSQNPHAVSPLWSDPILRTRRPMPHSRLNVVMISLDTLRADRLQCYGYDKATSPFLEEFARECVVFDEAIAPAGWTTPSHASVFTGLHPSAHGAGQWGVDEGYGRPMSGLPQAAPTLAEAFRRHGYLTAGYTEGVAVASELGFDQGFDLYNNGRRQEDSIAYVKETFGHAAAWLDSRRRMPFFLFVHTYEIHDPYRPPREFAEAFTQGMRRHSVYYPSDDATDELKAWFSANYDAEIACTDAALAEFVARLRAMDVLENTLLVIFSDHGEEFWEHGSRGHLQHLYEEIVHVPLMIRLPGGDPPAMRVRGQVCLTDLFTTVLELAGVPVEAPPDSYSLLPLIRGESSYGRLAVLSEIRQPVSMPNTPRVGEWMARALRTPDGKYIASEQAWAVRTGGRRMNPDAAPVHVEEYYRLEADPAEKNNLCAADSVSCETWRDALRTHLEQMGGGSTFGSDAAHPMGPNEVERMRALGYLD